MSYLMLREDEFVCEVCGRPATMHVTDLKEIEPEFRDGFEFRRWQEEGRHHYCDWHARAPKRIFRPRWRPHAS